MSASLEICLNMGDDGDFFGTLESKKPSNLNEVFNVSTDLNEKTDNEGRIETAKLHKAVKADSKSNWSTVFAKVITAYKDTVSVGKVGVAILLNLSGNEGKLILYKTKRDVLATKTLNGGNEIFHKAYSYIQLYDDSQYYWSLLFDHHKDEDEFISKLQLFQIKVENSVHISEKNWNKDEFDSKNVNEKNEDKQNIIDKQTVVCRMAKMGKALPLLQSNQNEEKTNYLVPEESCESVQTDEIVTDIAQATYFVPPSHKLQTGKEQCLPNSTSNFSTFSTSSMESHLIQMLLSENRTQNSETRMNISKLESKIEKVLEKLESISISSTSDKINKPDMLGVEKEIVALRKENRKLKNLNEEIKEENFTNTEEILKIYYAKLDSLGLRKTNDLDYVLFELLKIIKDLQDRLVNNDNNNASKCKELQLSITNLKEQNSKVLESHNELEVSLSELEASMKNSIVENDKLKLEVLLLKQQNEESTEKVKLHCTNTIKTLMNNLHHTLCEEVEKIPILSQEQVLTIIGSTIREKTLKILEEFKS